MINEAYKQSIELLRDNATRYGFLAASPSKRATERRYQHVFGRDAMICSLGALVSGEQDLKEVVKASLETLAHNISPEGQIPFAVGPRDKYVRYRFPKSVDGNIWWLIVYWLYSREGRDQSFDRQYKEYFYQTIKWLEQRMHWGLIEQGEAADWADEMPRSGMVLYSNALWLKFLEIIKSKESKEIYKNFTFFFSRENIDVKKHQQLNEVFRHYRKNVKKVIKPKSYFLTAISRVNYEDSFDIYGNILVCLSGMVPENRVKQIIEDIKKSRASSPYPIRVLDKPIVKLKQGIFEMEHQNKPWLYHNAGAWPFVGGLWVCLLAKYKYNDLAKKELVKLAKVNQINKWEFNEFFHGRTGKPMGVKRQTWNAATYIMAYQAVVNKKLII